MSTADLEAKLSATDDPAERHAIAVAAVGESLREAQHRAQLVADLENARDDTHAPIAASAANMAALIDPILGMWKH